MNKKKIFAVIGVLAISTVALAQSQIANNVVPKMLSWGFSAPSVSGASSNLPTASAGDIAFDIATSPGIFKGFNGSNWVNFGGSGATDLAVRSVTSTDSATPSDDVLLLSGSNFVETLFSAVGNTGKVLRLIHNGTNLTNVYTLNTTAGQTIGGVASGSYALYTNGEELTIMSDGSNWQIVGHNTSTDWIDAGVTTITATGTNPVKGTTSRDKVFWRRSGRDMHVIMQYSQPTNSGASAGSGKYLFAIPGGQSIDTTLTGTFSGTNLVGNFINVGSFSVSNSVTAGIGGVSVNDANNVAFFATSNTSTTVTFVSTLPFYSIVDTAIAYSASFSVPISGWQP